MKRRPEMAGSVGGKIRCRTPLVGGGRHWRWQGPLVTSQSLHPEVARLYKEGSNQCSLCGLRYGRGERERAEYREHLDCHFRWVVGRGLSSQIDIVILPRMNRREKDNARNGVGRQWYSSASNWVQGHDDGNHDADDDVTEGEHCEKKVDMMRIVPARQIKTISCPVCLEEFDEFYKQVNRT